MKRKKTVIALLLMVSTETFAGGLLTNTNQNIAFNRNFARNATFEIDGVYSNPAGLAWLGNGFHLSLNGQSAFQTRNITSIFMPFKQNDTRPADANGVKRFKGEAAVPLVPSFQGAYQQGDWTISMNFAITGGGGRAVFNEGLPSFESQVAMLPSMLSAAGIASDKYDVESYMRGRQYVYGLQAGLTYRIFDNKGEYRQGLAAYAGARMNYISNRYEGYLRNMSANVGGTMTNLNTYFVENAAAALEASQNYAAAALQAEAVGNSALAAQYQAASTQYATASKTYSAYGARTADMELDCTQRGWGITAIVGLDYRIGDLNLGMKYEFPTRLNIENETSVNTTGVVAYDHGVNTPNDLPAILTFGAQYELMPEKWRVMAGYTYYFDKDAGMANDKQKVLTHNTWEITAGTEWDITKHITVSGGFMKTSYGLSDAFQSDMSFACSSYSIGLGTKVKLNKNIDVNLAYFWTNYNDYHKTADNYNGTGLPGTDDFSRTNKVFGAGVNWRF